MSPLIVSALLVIGGCYGLYRGGNWLIDGVKGIGADLGWPSALIGLLLVSVGTSAPELFVSVGAAIQGYGDIAAGNAIGSNIVNLAIVLGIGAVIAVLPVGADMRNKHIPVMAMATVIAAYFLSDGHLQRVEALALLVAAAVGLAWAINGTSLDVADEELPDGGSSSLKRDLARAGLGVVGLAIGAEALIHGGSRMAALFGVPEAVIALTVTSIGTGLPEIVATVFAVARQEVELAIGNIVGSNLMNLGLVLAVSGLIVPLDASGLGIPTLLYLVGLTFGLLALAWRPGRVNRPLGGLLLLTYAAYLGWLLT